VRAIGVLAGAHAAEEIEALFGGAIAIGARSTRLGQCPAVSADLLCGEAVDVGEPPADQLLGVVVELLEVVGGEEQPVPPVETEPADVALDRLDVLDVLLGRVRVVEAEVAGAAVVGGEPEVEADALRVPEVEVAVRLRGEAGRDAATVLSAPAVLLDEGADEV
jgi:hypothetical protein